MTMWPQMQGMLRRMYASTVFWTLTHPDSYGKIERPEKFP